MNRDGKCLRTRFDEFHRDNPHVYDALVALAREAKSLGHSRIGVRTLLEVCRWQWWIKTKSNDDYKLNNSYAPFYARLIMEKEPDLDGLFVLRKQPSQGETP